MSGKKAPVRKILPDVPIIAQTAYSTFEDRERSKFAGCDEFISKPINAKKLNFIINKYLIAEQYI